MEGVGKRLILWGFQVTLNCLLIKLSGVRIPNVSLVVIGCFSVLQGFQLIFFPQNEIRILRDTDTVG